MPTKFPELFIDAISLERETVTKISEVIIDENLTWKTVLTQLPQRFLKTLVYFIEQG